MDTPGERVKALRTMWGMSQRELADGLPNVTPAYISYIESGSKTPSRNTMEALASKLCTTALWIEFGDGEHVCPECGTTVEATRILAVSV